MNHLEYPFTEEENEQPKGFFSRWLISPIKKFWYRFRKVLIFIFVVIILVVIGVPNGYLVYHYNKTKEISADYARGEIVTIKKIENENLYQVYLKGGKSLIAIPDQVVRLEYVNVMFYKEFLDSDIYYLDEFIPIYDIIDKTKLASDTIKTISPK